MIEDFFGLVGSGLLSPTSIDKRFPALLCIVFNEVRCTEEIRMTNTKDSSGTVNETLRLVWPQWQGAGVESIRDLFSEVPFEEARRGYGSGANCFKCMFCLARRLCRF
jgi:hypothetical protein